MAGIYLHIPFCKQACYYCDFHFTTSLNRKEEMLKALQAELTLRKDYLNSYSIETIYFGGGTPSLLKALELQNLIDHISELFDLASSVEITLEANPDDLNSQKVKELKQTSINRFSIGVQSFFEEDLLWMNRAHTANEAESSIKRVQDAEFENISIDLIYGYPLLSHEKWDYTIQQAINLQVPHLSTYSMTVEPQTALASFIRKGKQKALNEAQSAQQFTQLMDRLESTDFEHYEISNFAKPNRYSRHNSNYWQEIAYLGIGPSAHSFNGKTRQWNIANNSAYVRSIENKIIPAEVETLTTTNRINEYILTTLRTSRGMNLSKIKQSFGENYTIMIEHSLEQFLKKDWIELSNNIAILTKKGKLFADHITAELFIEEQN